MAVAMLDPIGLQVAASPPDTAAPLSTSMRVLVVDDTRVVRQVIVRMLALQGGFEICEAETYLEAVELLERVDAVSTDGFFPHHAGGAVEPWGLELARLARAHGKRVVLVSGDSALVAQARWEGIRALEKPRGVLQLAEALAETEAPPPLTPQRSPSPAASDALIGGGRAERPGIAFGRG